MPEDKDPWKDPPQEPELDLWLKKIRARWGRRRPPGRDPWRGLRRNHRLTLLIPFVVLLVFWLSTGLVSIPTGRVGYAFVLGHAEGTLGSGMHWLPPWPFTRVLRAAAPSRGARLLRMHVLTDDGRLLVARLRYRIRVIHPRRAALTSAGLSRLRRARLRHILARVLLSPALKNPTKSGGIETIRRALIRLWSRPIPSPRGVKTPPGRDALSAAAPWGRLDVLGLVLVPPRPLRKEAAAFVDLAQRQDALLLAARRKAKTRLALVRLEAETLRARERRRDKQILARAQNRIAVFRSLLPVYRRDPVLARRLLALELLRRGIRAQRVTLSFGRKLRIVLGPIVPTPPRTHAPASARAKPPKPPPHPSPSPRRSM